MKNNNMPIYLLTLLYFAMGFVNITASLLAFVCIIAPFAIVAIKNKKLWCSSMCPRADFFSLFKNVRAGSKAPKYLIGKGMKRGILIYFIISFSFAILTTILVGFGRIKIMDSVRLFIFFRIPVNMPQIFDFSFVSDFIIHFSYRLYSIMLSSTILGTTLALLFKPKSWCAICPMNTLSSALLKKQQCNMKKAS